MDKQIDESPATECHGLVLEPHRLLEISDGQVMVSVDRAEIRSVSLREGLLSPHPFLQAGMGLVLTALAYFPLLHLIHWLREGGTIFAAEALLIPLALLGVWITFTAFRRGRYLAVESAQGRKRFAFDGRATRGEVETFVQALERAFQLPVVRHQQG